MALRGKERAEEALPEEVARCRPLFLAGDGQLVETTTGPTGREDERVGKDLRANGDGTVGPPQAVQRDPRVIAAYLGEEVPGP